MVSQAWIQGLRGGLTLFEHLLDTRELIKAALSLNHLLSGISDGGMVASFTRYANLVFEEVVGLSSLPLAILELSHLRASVAAFNDLDLGAKFVDDSVARSQLAAKSIFPFTLSFLAVLALLTTALANGFALVIVIGVVHLFIRSV